MLAFVHIEKCGGSTLIDILRSSFVLDHFDMIPRNQQTMLLQESDLRDALRLRPSLASIAGHSVRYHANLHSVVPDIKYITCLRDPIRRYMSEYHFYGERLGRPMPFEEWLSKRERHDFQTRSIAGSNDLPRAKELLSKSFALVGVLEQFEDFLRAFRQLAVKDTNRIVAPNYQVKNTRRVTRKSDTVELLSKYKKEIEDANRLDMQLYEFVKNEVFPKHLSVLTNNPTADEPIRTMSFLERVASTRRQIVYRAFRNFIYKPYMGYWPGKHTLPDYRRDQDAKAA